MHRRDAEYYTLRLRVSAVKICDILPFKLWWHYTASCSVSMGT